MKVLGISSDDSYKRKYIIEISADEINTIFQNNYDTTNYRKMRDLKPGDEVDLSGIFKLYDNIKSLFNSMNETMKEFERTKDTIYQFSRIFGPEADNGKL